jgi:hypothetical protein
VMMMEGCQVKFLAKIPDVVGMAGFNLFERHISLPRLINIHKKSLRNRDLQVQILLKAIKQLPEFVTMVDHSSYYICINGKPIYRAPVLLNNKVVQVKEARFTSEGQFEVVVSGDIRF